MTMRKMLYRLWAGFLTVFGDVKIFKWPMFFLYDPDNMKVMGQQLEDIMYTLEPGDVILRGFDNYLDSYFISSMRSYSHAGIYIGKGMMIHAVAPNVERIHVLDFCRCDRIAILRPRKYKRKAIRQAKEFADGQVAYDFCFEHGRETLYCFELIKECYPDLKIDRQEKTAFFGLLRRNVVLSDQLLSSPDMTLVYEYNPKYNIRFG